MVVRRGVAVTGADLDRLCLDNIARFKRPKGYRFVAALPKNNYGKVLKRELREMLGRSVSDLAHQEGVKSRMSRSSAGLTRRLESSIPKRWKA